MLFKNGYPNPMIDNFFNTEINKLNIIKPYGSKKYSVLFALSINRHRPNET